MGRGRVGDWGWVEKEDGATRTYIPFHRACPLLTLPLAPPNKTNTHTVSHTNAPSPFHTNTYTSIHTGYSSSLTSSYVIPVQDHRPKVCKWRKPSYSPARTRKGREERSRA